MKMAPEVLVNREERERVETRESNLRSDCTQKIPQEMEVIRNSKSMLGGMKTVLAQRRELMKVPKLTWKSIPLRVMMMSMARRALTRTYSLPKRRIRFGHVTKHLRRMPSGDSRTGSGGPTFHSPCGNLYSSINTSISEKSTLFGVEVPQTRPLCTPCSTSSLLSIKLNLKDQWCLNLPGWQPSIVTQKWSSMFTHIDPENSRTTRVGCKRSLDTVGTEVSSLSSRLMKPSEQCSQETTGLHLTISSQLPHSSTACLDKGRASMEDPRGGTLTKETGIFVGGTMSEKPTKPVGSDTSS